MGKKALGSILIIFGLVLVILSSVNLFLIQRESSTYRFLIAMSRSMEPTFFKGDVLKVDCTVPIDEIFVAPKNADPPGDIIVYRGLTSLIVHRVVDKTIKNDGTYSFETWGDANGSARGFAEVITRATKELKMKVAGYSNCFLLAFHFSREMSLLTPFLPMHYSP